MSQSQETPEVPEEQVAGAQDPATGPAAGGSRPADGADAGPDVGADARPAGAEGTSRGGGAESEAAPEAQDAPVGGATPGAEDGPDAGSVPGAEPAGAQAPGDADAAAADAQEPSNPQELSDPLSEAMNTISSLEDQLARRAADLYNLEQQYSSYVRRSKGEAQVRKDEGVASVIEALLPVLDDAELARAHGDLTGPVGAIVEKFEQTLRTSFGVERYGAVGDEFDPLIHEALMHSASADVASEQVGTLIQPGYRIGEKVLRPARVGVVSPE